MCTRSDTATPAITDAPTTYRPMAGGGGSRMGVHYLSEFVQCPMRWFLRYAYPAGPNSELTGLTTHHTSPPLLTGTAYHAGVEELYRSGWRDGADTGEWDLERAVAKVEAEFTARESEWADTDKMVAERQDTIAMIHRYRNHFGKGGKAPEQGHLELLATPDGEPALEVEYEIPVGNRIMTARIDALVRYHGIMMVCERKTSSRVSSTLQTYSLKAQPLALLLLVNHHHPEPVTAILLDIAHKKHTSGSRQPEFLRSPISHAPDLLQQFVGVAERTLDAIDNHMGVWNIRVKGGMDPMDAAFATFPLRGLFNDKCFSFQRECAFARVCRNPSTASNQLPTYRPRIFTPVEVPDEDGE